MPTKRVKSLPEVRKLHLGIGNIKRRTGCAGSPKCVLTETHGGFINLILFLIPVSYTHLDVYKRQRGDGNETEEMDARQVGEMSCQKSGSMI